MKFLRELDRVVVWFVEMYGMGLGTVRVGCRSQFARTRNHSLKRVNPTSSFGTSIEK
jgi:hypothetical protein